MLAICVGHSRPGDSGALSVGGVTEHTYNSALARRISDELTRQGVPHVIISHYDAKGYGAAMRWLAAYLRKIGVKAAIELHFNSADNPDARGHEWLYWNASYQGRLLASSFKTAMLRYFPLMKSRGIKAIFPSDRGAEFLRLTSCPAVICEPFFGSSQEDWDLMSDDSSVGILAKGIAESLKNFWEVTK